MESRWSGVVVALGVAVFAAAPFARAIAFPFLGWDDDFNLVRNPGIRGFGSDELRWMWSTLHAGHFMPLTWMSCALDFAVAGLDPAQFHATNVVLHAVTALVLYLAIVELLERSRGAREPTRARFAAAVGALFFAVHPLRVESVAWATERRDVLSGAFAALSIWAWLRSLRPHASRAGPYLLSIASFAASLLSKASAMTLPFALLALDAWPLRRNDQRGWRALVAEKLPYFALGAAAAIVGYLGQRDHTGRMSSLAELGILQRLTVSASALCSYVRRTIWPADLSAFYELPQSVDPWAPRFLVPLVLVALATVVLALARRRSPLASAAWTSCAVFVILLAPVIGLVHTGEQLSADRYTYLPSFACAGALAALCNRASARKLAPWVAASLVALGGLAWRQTGHWRDTEVLFRRVVEVEPASYFGHHKLGVLAFERGAIDEARTCFDRALALRPASDNADTQYGVALIALADGEYERARASMTAALADDPTHAGARQLARDLASVE
jgi:tetratricopeptide (TPR) repeat protein